MHVNIVINNIDISQIPHVHGVRAERFLNAGNGCVFSVLSLANNNFSV